MKGEKEFEKEPGYPQQKDIIEVVLFGGITLKGEVIQDTGKMFKLITGEIIPNHAIIYWKHEGKIQNIDMTTIKEEEEEE